MLANGIQVFDAKGRIVSGTPRVSPGDPRIVEAPLSRVPRGGYTVRWATISNDSHVGRGVFTFGVRAPAPADQPGVRRSGPTTSEHVVRWLYFVCLALLTGGLGFRLLVLRGRRTEAAERRFYRLTGIGVVAALQVGIVAFLLRAEDALQLPFTAFLYGDLSPFAQTTRFGKAFVAMELGFALVAALLFLAWLTGRRVLLWAAFVLSLGLGSGLSLASHQSDDRGWLPSARRLGAPVGGVALDRRPALARARRLERPRAAPNGVLALLGARRPARRARRRGRRLHDVQALPGARTTSGTSATGSVLLVKLGLVCWSLCVGCVPPLRRAPAPRPPGGRAAAPEEPARRGDGRGRDPAARRRSSSTRSRPRSRPRRRKR